MSNTSSSASSAEVHAYLTGTGNGFWWNGVWHDVKPSHGDDDGPPTGVREPRVPRKPAPAGSAARVLHPELVTM
jgi:hypothetical protein